MAVRCCKNHILRDIAGISAASTIAQTINCSGKTAVASVYDLKPRFQSLPMGDCLPATFCADGCVGEPLAWQGERATMQVLEARFDELEGKGGQPAWE